jgi:GntR family transcriptional regulator
MAIATGKLEPGAQLPTVRQLAVDLHVNANTVARVYAALERTEVVETQRGVGTFVRATPPASVISENRERELDRLISRLIPEVAALGFTTDDVIMHLHRRIKQEKNAHAADRQ